MKDINLFKTKVSFYFRKVKSKEEALSDLECDGFLIQSSEKIARGIVASLRDKKFEGKIALVGGDDAFNRRAIETLKIDYLVSPEALTSRDTLKQRDSGLNHVAAKAAKEKGVGIVFDVGSVSRLKGVAKALRIARIMQNVKICRKAGCKVLIASFGKNKSEVVNELGRKSFGINLGMSSKEARDSCLF